MEGFDLKLFNSFCTDNIANTTQRETLRKFGPNLGLLLQWIDEQKKEINENPACPFQTKINATAMTTYDSVWGDFLKGKKNAKEKLGNLRGACATTISENSEFLESYKETQQTIDRDYSSYSDYSESDTTSEEEEDDEAEDDEGEGEEVELEKQPRRYFRRRR